MKKWSFAILLVMTLLLTFSSLPTKAEVIMDPSEGIFLTETNVYDLDGHSTNGKNEAMYIWQYNGSTYIALDAAKQVYTLNLKSVLVNGTEIIANSESAVYDIGTGKKLQIYENDVRVLNAETTIPHDDQHWIVIKAPMDHSTVITLSVILYMGDGGFGLSATPYTVSGGIDVTHAYGDIAYQYDYAQSVPTTLSGLPKGDYTFTPATTGPMVPEGTWSYAGVTVTGITDYQVAANGTVTFTITAADTTSSIDIQYTYSKSIVITGDSSSLTYNGSQQSLTDYDVAGLPAGYTVTGITYMAEGTDVGSYDGAFQGTVMVKNGTTDVTSHFNITYVPGTLEITKKAVTITVNDADKMYGAADPAFSGTVNGLVNSGDLGTVSYSRINSDEAVGTYDDVLTADYTTNNNYDVTIVPGKFTITADENPIVITANSNSWIYDDASHSDDGFTITYDGAAVTADGDGKYFLPNGDEITVTVTGSITDVGTITNSVAYTLENEGSYSDVTANDGLLTVTAKAVTITVNDADKVYGTADPAFSGTVNGLVNSADLGTVSYSRTNSDEAAGTYDDVLTADYTANTNYDVTIVPGKFTITADENPIVITANSNSWIYDGASHSDDGFTITCDGAAVTADGDGKYFLPNGDEITVTVTGSITDVGTATNSVAYTLENEGSYSDVTANDGLLTVTAKAVTITVNDAVKTVGNPDPIFSGTVNGLVNSGDLGTVTYSRINSDETAGTYNDVLTAGYTANTNYDVTVVPGDFIIAMPIIIENDNVIVITANSNSWIYDGASHSDDGFTITCDGAPVTADGDGKYFLPNGDEITVTVTGSITDVGTAVNLADYDITTEGTYPYVTVNNGTLVVTAKPVTITVNDADKFVGEADPSFSGTIDGLVNAGDLGTVSYYRTNLAEDAGTYTGVITAGYTENSNYDVTVVPADFTINPLLNDEDHFAYIIGYPDGNVGPGRNITRAEVATIFYRLLTEKASNTYSTSFNPFSDVPDGAWYSTAVMTLRALNIVKGYPDNTFQPDGHITRAEFAAIAARFDGSGDTTPSGFTDIAGHWAEDEINIAANNGWVKGYEDHSFRPDLYITRAEAVTLINNVLNRIPASPDALLTGMIIWPDNMDTTKWYYLAMQEATNSHYYERNEDGTETWTALKPNIVWPH